MVNTLRGIRGIRGITGGCGNGSMRSLALLGHMCPKRAGRPDSWFGCGLG